MVESDSGSGSPSERSPGSAPGSGGGSGSGSGGSGSGSAGGTGGTANSPIFSDTLPDPNLKTPDNSLAGLFASIFANFKPMSSDIPTGEESTSTTYIRASTSKNRIIYVIILGIILVVSYLWYKRKKE